MSNIYDLNKKNVKLKNISTNSSVHHTKINISNLIAETQRIISSSIKNKINNQHILNTNINSPKFEITSKETQNSNDFYRSYSSNRPHSKQSILNKRNNININLNTEKSQNINDSYLNITNKNQKKKPNPSPSEMLSTFAHFAQNLNKNQNKKKNKNIHYTNLGIKSIYHKRNPQSNIELRYIKKSGITTNNSLININNISTNDNRNNISYINQTQYQQFSNITEINKKNKEKKNLGKNFSNDRFDLINKHKTPLSPSCTYNHNNMNHLLNEIFKSSTHNNKNENEIKRNVKNNIQTQSHSENSQGIIMTTQSTKNKNSFNSTKTEGENKIIINNNNNNNLINNQNKIQNINLITMNIDTPEELHFFYINILQNGKVLEGKFEITNSINP